MEGTRGPLEEIIVTARYREERLQEIPIAITAIDADEIEMRAFTVASDVAYAVPNASFRPAQAAFGNTMTAFIRGIGQYDFDFAFEPGVAIYIDDMYHPFTLGSQTQLMDLDHVEVLRGPQGTLFGRGSIGGAIRYVSKKPQGDDTGSIGLTLGEFDRVDVRASYDFAITDSVAARVTGVSTAATATRTSSTSLACTPSCPAVCRSSRSTREPAARSARRAGPTTSAVAARFAGKPATTSRFC